MPDTDLDSTAAPVEEIVDGVVVASGTERTLEQPATDSENEADDAPPSVAVREPPSSAEPDDTPETSVPIPMWKKVTAAGAWIVAVFFLFMVLANGSDATRDQGETGVFLLPQEQNEVVPEDTLGIRFSEVREAWNTVDQPPFISAPLRRTPESGQLDSFFYGLDSKAEILGAYRDSDDYLVGLLVTARLDHEAISTLYLHVCHIVSPFTPDCLDEYESIGLAGKTLAELSETGSETTWTSDGNTWRVNVSDRQLTIRVISPAAS